MRGLRRLHEEVGFANFWDVDHAKTTPNFRSDADRVDWNFYQQLRSGGLGLQPRYYHRDDEYFAFAREQNGLPGGDQLEILSPTPEIVRSCNARQVSNDLSYVLRVSHAGRSVLLTGDVEASTWNELERYYGPALKNDVLQASHHGRDTGYHLNSLKLINPSTIVVSVGRKPETDASRKYRAQCPRIFSTRYYGNLTLLIDDYGNMNWTAQRNGK